MFIGFAAILLTALAQAAAAGYDSAHAAAVKRCQAIDPRESQSGLAFNPDGYRSYYEQSACFQKAAVEFRDLALCASVRQRRAVLSSSWGYSPGNCRTLVNNAIASDRQELRALRQEYLNDHIVLRDFRIERNGNGRDYDFIPSFAGAVGHAYGITIEILPPSGAPVIIHHDGYYVDARGTMSLFLMTRQITARLPAFEPGATYRVRATMTFSVPARGGSRWLSDAFLESVFSVRERSQSITRDVRF